MGLKSVDKHVSDVTKMKRARCCQQLARQC
jgi:hypothetical protein